MSVQQLLDTMGELDRLHQELLELAGSKKQVLINNDIDLLNRIVHKEGQLTKKIAEIETERMEAANRILIARGFRPHPGITVTDLIKLVFKAEDKLALNREKERMLVTLTKLKEANGLNQKLLEQSIKFVNYSLDLITGPPDDDVIYRNPVTQSTSLTRPGIFDSRA